MAEVNSHFSVVLIVMGAITIALDAYVFGGNFGTVMGIIGGAGIGFGVSGVVGE
jgi:hypothetical protein